jgi:glyoxylase-like metal-dependent hydrolase (beta-lactamase superfamily II)
MRATWRGTVVVLLALAAPAAAQRDFSQVEIKTVPAAGSVYMLQGAGGNIGVSAGPDGLLIVDDQYAPLSEKIRTALKAINPGKLAFVLNTHWHGDHTGGNATFAAEATVIAHDNVRKRLSSEQTVFGEKVPPSPAEALPVVTFDRSLTVHFNGEEIRAIHFPHGHTDGDSVIFFTKSNVVHMGDDFFAGTFPFVDLGSGGSVEGLIDNVAKVLSEVPADVKIIPGHGPLSTVEDLRRYHQMLVATTGIVRERMAAGKSRDEIVAAGLPEEWASWGAGFIKTDAWLQTIHQSLSNPGGGAGSAPRHPHGHDGS